MNVRPKTSSSGGTRVLGVVVLVMNKASGLMSGSLVISSSCDCILYGLMRCQLGLESGVISALAAAKQDLAPYSARRRIMVVV